MSFLTTRGWDGWTPRPPTTACMTLHDQSRVAAQLWRRDEEPGHYTERVRNWRCLERRKLITNAASLSLTVTLTV